MADFATLEGDGWRIGLPEGLIARDHTAWGCESGSIARGWIGEAPVTVVIQRQRLDRTFNQWVKDLTAYWLEFEPPRPIDIPGAKDARRIDGYIEFDGLGAKDDREHCTTVAASL